MKFPVKYPGILVILVLLLTLVSIPASAGVQADLEPTSIAVTALYAGVDNNITVVIANNSTVASGEFTLKLEYSVSGGEYSLIGTQSGSVSSSDDPYYYPLNANFNWIPPSPGSYSLRVIVDSAEAVAESDETNNLLIQQVTVMELTDISVHVRVEGKTATIFSGTVTFCTSSITDKQGNTFAVDHPTALGALDQASQDGAFNYIVSSSWGPLSFLEKIAGEANDGMDGWLCSVNWQGLNAAAVDCSLSNGDEVLWYYGAWTAQPLKLTLDQSAVLASDTFNATVEAFDGLNWKAVEGAELKAGSDYFITNSSGKVTDISLSPGSYSLSASLETCETYIRSNTETLLVYLPLLLEPGWNFISVPRHLAADNSSAGSLFAGVDTNGHSIFSFDPAGDGWEPLQSEDTISPLDGIWIYSRQQVELRPVFNTDRRQVPPTKTLSSGWNAIGYSDFEPASANSSLTSLENLWSILIGFNAASQVYETSIINNAPEGDAHSEIKTMHPWKGYWLYLTAAGELAALSN
jgi:hypothetical protein